MKEVKVESTFFLYNDVNDIPSDVQQLMQKASTARDNAYAPYSKFHVGAAILLDNKEVVTGSNQENASYPLCLCAERVTISAADSVYPKLDLCQLVRADSG